MYKKYWLQTGVYVLSSSVIDDVQRSDMHTCIDVRKCCTVVQGWISCSYELHGPTGCLIVRLSHASTVTNDGVAAGSPSRGGPVSALFCGLRGGPHAVPPGKLQRAAGCVQGKAVWWRAARQPMDSVSLRPAVHVTVRLGTMASHSRTSAWPKWMHCFQCVRHSAQEDSRLRVWWLVCPLCSAHNNKKKPDFLVYLHCLVWFVQMTWSIAISFPHVFSFLRLTTCLISIGWLIFRLMCLYCIRSFQLIYMLYFFCEELWHFTI